MHLKRLGIFALAEVVILLATSLLVCAEDDASHKHAQVLGAQAEQLIDEGKCEEAVALLQQAISIEPNSAEYQCNLAVALNRTGSYGRALKHAELATQLDKANPNVWPTYGESLAQTGEFGRAAQAYEQFIKLAPGDPAVNATKDIVTNLKRQAASGATAGSDNYFLAATKGERIRWTSDKMPLKVFIEPGNNVAGFKPIFQTILQESFAQWANQSSGKVSFAFVGDQNKADIDVCWSGHPDQSAEGGVCEAKADEQGLAKVRITVLTVSSVAGEKMTDQSLRSTCLHEIGHALGLRGHSPNRDDVMFAFTDTSRTNNPKLSMRDAKTLIMLYSTNKARDFQN